MAKNIFKNPNFAFWLFTISVAIGLTLPWLVQEGMFMDGLLYSCVSRNLGHGIGSFWFPQFSELNVGGLPSFHEQPPLVFGIQAIFFYFFGNSIYIERGYTFLMLLLSIYFIYLIWKEINSSTKDQIPYGWLAILLWISTSLAFWSFRHNMQENTMGIFTLLSVLFIFKGFNKPNNQILFFSVSGVFITLSLLSKGFPGLFPISVPFLYWITHRKPGFAKMFSQSAILLMIPVLIITLLLLFPDSRQSLSYYFFDRILQRIDYMPTIENRFYIINRLLMELIASVIIVFLFAISLYLINVKLITKSNSSLALLFILIGFSGSVPLCLTMVQKGFYFTPSLPYFGIGLALLVTNGLKEAILSIRAKSTGFQIFKYFSLGLFITIIVFSVYRFGSYGRHKQIIEDVKVFSTIVPKNSVVTIPNEMWDEYNFRFQGYLMRYAYISINPYKLYDYCIVEKANNSIPQGYEIIELATQKYDLYKKK